MRTLWNNASKKSRITAISLLAITFVAAIAAGMSYGSAQEDVIVPNAKLNPNDPAFTVYECAGDRSIWAAYKDASVTLSLSDGSNVSLPQATSGSGARFANRDESIVFWSKGRESSLQENGSTTYAGCVQKDRESI